MFKRVHRLTHTDMTRYIDEIATVKVHIFTGVTYSVLIFIKVTVRRREILLEQPANCKFDYVSDRRLVCTALFLGKSRLF